MTQSFPPDPAKGEASASPQSHPPEVVDTLKRAMRRARHDDAERAGAVAELRAARLGRLELLQDALQPLVAQIPADVDLFDVALVPSSEPRLFIDMIGFVEMARDARLYKFVQDTRHGRIQIAESESLDAMVDAVTDYVARRLLERDKALAADARARDRAGDRKAGTVTRSRERADHGRASRAASDEPVVPAERPARRGPLHWLGIGFAFLIDLLGSIAFFTILAAIGWYLWTRTHGAT